MARNSQLLAALFLSLAPSAHAQPFNDAGAPGDAGSADAGDCTPSAPTADGGCGIQATVFTSNVGCSSGAGGFPAVLGFIAAAALLRRRRSRASRRRAAGVFSALLLLAAAVPARADEVSPNPYPPFTGENQPLQRVAITASPLAAFIGRRIGASVSILLVSHHALELTLFHIDQLTGSDTNNEFAGWGQELGYRYYSGERGPRGFFIGPSLLLGHYTAIPLVGGDRIRYSVPGVALDLGYQSLPWGRLVVGIGAGLQYTRPGATLPQQEIPASNYANEGVRPRALLALGFSFISI